MKKKVINENLNSLSFLRVASVSLDIKLGDIEWNTRHILELIKELSSLSCNAIVFQPLSITGGSLTSLFLDGLLLKNGEDALLKLVEETKEIASLIFVGLPLKHNGAIYSSIAVIYKGKILFIYPLEPSCYTYKAFSKYDGQPTYVRLGGRSYLFGYIYLNLLLQKNSKMLRISNDEIVSLCDEHQHGIINFVFSDAPMHVGNIDSTIDVYKTISGITKSAIVYSSPSITENYAGLAYSSFTGIFENGHVLSLHSKLGEHHKTFLEKKGIAERTVETFSYSDVDLEIHSNSNMIINDKKILEVKIQYVPSLSLFDIVRPVSIYPYISFIPPTKEALTHYAATIFNFQIEDIRNRLDSIGIERVVLGLSGGLDSTLALLFLVASFRAYKFPLTNIHALTLPCFGSTSHTKKNALSLCKILTCKIDEIDIKSAVRGHFRDIGQDDEVYDVTYENAQARERTQVLMDKANQIGGIVIGSSDLSEIALGFSTFNGDHMSMYNVLGAIPKTVVRICIQYALDFPHLFLSSLGDAPLFTKILKDILETPISPELLPPKCDEIVQKTEDILGSYELQDFFIYYVCHMHYNAKRIFLFASKAFPNYSPSYILKALKIFYKRFFTSQFKRNCSPEHANITGLSFDNYLFPSNTSSNLYLKELEELEKECFIEEIERTKKQPLTK